MLKKYLISFLLPFFLLTTTACTSMSQRERISLLQGDYQVQKGSDPSCQSGQLQLVGEGDEQGVRIGHHIYLGPFKDFVEPATKNSCRVSSQFSMLNDEITEQTIVDNCPNKSTNEEGVATHRLNFSNNKVTYSVVETSYICIYLKQESSNN